MTTGPYGGAGAASSFAYVLSTQASCLCPEGVRPSPACPTGLWTLGRRELE
jgi:hypothetical protein